MLLGSQHLRFDIRGEDAFASLMSLIDAFFRVAYRVAYQLARIYWRIARPDNQGALVMIWHAGRVLLIKNSYVNYFSLPGGHIKSSETPEQAAVRELSEEVGIVAQPQELQLALDHTHLWEGRTDHVRIFELFVEERPTIQVDNREVISAEWLTPEDALSRRLFRPLRQLIEARRLEASAVPPG